jgi:hypothetical protein
MQQVLKPAVRATRARIIAAELLLKLLVAVHDAISLLHVGFRREAFATFTGNLESTVRLD